MKPMTCDEIRTIVHGRWLHRGKTASIAGVATDTRTARPGQLFIALRGHRFDAQGFLDKAADAGCAAAIVHHEPALPAEALRRFAGGVIGVDDTLRALGELGAWQRKNCAAAVIAVTGSNGKTTVKRMIDHVLGKRLAGTCSPKSFNNNIGVPLTLLGASVGDDYVCCELGTNAPGEIAALTAMCAPDVAVITSVSATHLEKLVSVERVAAEKASILGGLQEGGLAIVCADAGNVGLDRALRSYNCRTIRFGACDEAELRLTGYSARAEGCEFQVNGRLRVRLGVGGRHNATNALAAIAVAQRFGFSAEEASAALEDFAGVEMRLQRVEAGAVTIINDAYNANPASMIAAADVLAETPARRRVMIVGDMGELGQQVQTLHRQVGRAIGERGISLVVGVGPMAGELASAAAEAGSRCEAFESVEAAQAGVAALLQPGDVVLIKASRSVGLERLVEPVRCAFAGAAAGRESSS